MRQLRPLIVIGAMLSVAQVANAGPLDDGLKAYVRGDFATALKLIRPLAEQGDAWAEYYLGEIFDPLEEIHFEGRGVAPDFKEALKWYRLSAGQDNAAAQLCLGDMYHMGQGVTRDEVRAYMWWDLAASSAIEKIDSTSRSLHNEAIRKENSVIVKDMTAEQVDQAVTMEKRCRKSNFKDCD
jgi:uncharacterized protein